MEKEKNAAQKGGVLRLDYKRTILVGFAFFGIMCFWEVYDYIMPLILNTRFGLNSWQYGLIMGLDNLLAIFLLPLFGSISDKSVNARMGRRTKFIFWGSIAAAAALIILSIFELLEFQKIMAAGYDDTAKLIGFNPSLADAIAGAGLSLDTSYVDLMATKDTTFAPPAAVIIVLENFSPLSKRK